MDDRSATGSGSTPHRSGPQHCPICHCDLVYPIYWRQMDAATWRLELRCPGCGAERAVSLGREAAHAFNLLLYQGTEQLAREAEELGRQRTASDEELSSAFAAALRRGHILPMDF